jgi:hypothetical protein
VLAPKLEYAQRQNTQDATYLALQSYHDRFASFLRPRSCKYCERKKWRTKPNKYSQHFCSVSTFQTSAPGVTVSSKAFSCETETASGLP